ncbi:hypothetical protein PLEOSDRAFT_1102434 [Pleurotus ostreatus PC15]|uniref:Uncharacterized protein n=1 Tax=Pleurotus ostreatus (strain PC15) TaxID=1137138 RepID=A0A067NWV0_PLEO1|nr:hypothetical protein PLEOSDRAFT_1102434 [Pleurotus ostreatus PC15]
MAFRNPRSLPTYTIDTKDEVSPQSSINDILNHRAQPLGKARNHTTSTGTRAPALWDQHLDQAQILKHVGDYDDLVQHLDGLVEEYAQKLGLFLSALEAELETCRNTDDPVMVKDEAEIVDYYSKAVGPACGIITSNLLGAESNILSWTKGTAVTQSKAMGDGYLHLDIKPICSSTSLGTDMKNNLLLVAAKFPDLLVFEFKSLMFDTDAKFESLRAIAAEEDYCWIRCLSGECTRTHYRQGQPQITCARMGPDCDADGPFPYPKYQQPDINNRKRPRGEEPNEPCQSGRLRAYSSDELKARHIIQQVYAAAVARDATFLVLRCGNRELIGLRNREHQTLHLSGIVDSAATTGPTYMRLHVGLYLATILDAIQRALRLEQGMGLSTWRDNWAQSRVRQGPPSLEKLLASARQMPKVVLHEPHLHSPMKVANPSFLRMEIDHNGETSSDHVMQIKNAIMVTERTYRATLQVMGGAMVVFLKLAISPTCRSNLVKEHTAYQTLAGKGNIPVVIGCFEYSEPNFHALALITLDAGMPIIPEDSGPSATVSFTTTLAAIHAAGYTHGSIDIDHFLSDGHKTTVVSLAKLDRYSASVAGAEMESLRSMLIPKRRRLQTLDNTEQTVVVQCSPIRDKHIDFLILLASHAPSISSTEAVLNDEHHDESHLISGEADTCDQDQGVSLERL